MENLTLPYSIEDIQKIIPHRSPFLLIDKITELDIEKGTATGYKAVSYNEPFFAGHFPQQPVMPGVLIIEALAQTGAVAVLSICLLYTSPSPRDRQKSRMPSSA